MDPRRDGLARCRESRRRLRDCLDGAGRAWVRDDAADARWWLASACWWYERLRREQELLVALRGGGQRAWRAAVLASWRAPLAAN